MRCLITIASRVLCARFLFVLFALDLHLLSFLHVPRPYSVKMFSRSLLLTLVSAPLMVYAQNANPFNIPTSGLSASAGQPLTLSWNPTTQGTVSLILRSGASSDLASGNTIACESPGHTLSPKMVAQKLTRTSSLDRQLRQLHLDALELHHARIRLRDRNRLRRLPKPD